MPSTKRVEPLDRFESDVRITPEDNAAQWRIRNERTISTAEYLAWCSWLSRMPSSEPSDLHDKPFDCDPIER